MDEIEASLRKLPDDQEQATAFTLGLIHQLTLLLGTSGATEEQALAALRAAEAVVPVMRMHSRHFQVLR